jgi:ATP-dependent helicase HrpB
VLGDAEAALLARIRFLARTMPELEWPGDSGALATEALEALTPGKTTLAELRTADTENAILGLLSARQRAALARDAPPTLRLPSGREVPIRYSPERPPAVAARIQELFGLRATPRLGGGRVALVVELLAPNQRPVQVTDDLASFWRTTYPEVRRQLRGRYPKHDWPEDPLSAIPSARPRRRQP